MRCTLFLVLVLVACCLASLPKGKTLRFKSVSGNEVAPNAVGSRALQEYAVNSPSLQSDSVNEGHLQPSSVYRDNVSPNAITARGLAIDLVTLTILNGGTVPAQSQNPAVAIPTGVASVFPYENQLRGTPGDNSDARVDYPNEDTSYRIEGKARGPGVILGWYPARNGHLLRYQSSRALRGLTCDSLTIAAATGSDGVFDDDDADTHSHGFINNIDCSGIFCTTIDCISAPRQVDPQCFLGLSPVQADRCAPYTSVADTFNDQEGVPVYSPTVERIEINAEGLVEMHYFGAGSVDPGVDNSVEITVVVLLNNQYGPGFPGETGAPIY